MAHSRIRPLVLALFRHQGRILVAEGYDPLKEKPFYRPLGGAIEFGEYSQQALEREIQEELGQAITNLRYLFTLENLFVFNGKPGHEIVLVYDADFCDPSLYDQPHLNGIEDDDAGGFTACWLDLAFWAGAEAPPLYPHGLLERLTNS